MKKESKWIEELVKAKESYSVALVTIAEKLDPDDRWGRDNIEDEYFSVAEDIRILSAQDNAAEETSTLRKFPRIH